MPDITMIETYDSAMILDQEENEWTQGWLKVYKRHKVVNLFGQTSPGGSYVSFGAFSCAPYSELVMLMNISAPAAPDQVIIQVLVSDDNANWYVLKDEAVKSLAFGGGVSGIKIALSIKCIAPFIKLSAAKTGGSYTLTAKGVLIS